MSRDRDVASGVVVLVLVALTTAAVAGLRVSLSFPSTALYAVDDNQTISVVKCLSNSIYIVPKIPIFSILT